jgi:hypothetical protein
MIKLEDIKPGILLFEREDREWSNFKARIYRLVFNKSSKEFKFFEIFEGDAHGEWFWAIRIVDEDMWWRGGWKNNKMKIIPLNKLFDVVFREMEFLEEE